MGFKITDKRASKGMAAPAIAVRAEVAPPREDGHVAQIVSLQPIRLRRISEEGAGEPEPSPMRTAPRPTARDEYVGQEALISRLEVIIRGAMNRGQLPGHILLSGPPGYGKTTLANIIAEEIGTKVHHASGMSLRSAKDLAELVKNFEPGAVLAIDEIHRLPTIVEEALYEPLEDQTITVSSPNATHKIDVAPFILVGMTTRPGDLSEPLRDRFSFHGVMAPYAVPELAEIVGRLWEENGTRVKGNAAVAVAERCKGVPRIAVHLARLVEDAVLASGGYAVEGTEAIVEVDEESAVLAMEHFGIWRYGLDEVDRRILVALAERYSGGPVGVANLARTLAMDEGVIADEHEPALVRADMMLTTPRGRALTTRGWEIVEEMKREGVVA